MHVIITRPIEDSLELIRNLKIINHTITYLPLINVRKISNENIKFKDYKGIIFTSANAIKFLNINDIPKNIYWKLHLHHLWILPNLPQWNL